MSSEIDDRAPVGASKAPPKAPPEAALVHENRVFETGVLADTAPEDPRLVAYKAQYAALPDAHKNCFTWDQVSARLLANPEKLERALKMQGGGHLFWVEADGTVNFRDKGVEPVMYVVNTQTEEMTPIFDYETQAIERAKAEIVASRAMWQAGDRPLHESPQGRQTLDWANGTDIEKQLAKDGYELFPCEPGFDPETNHETFGPAMDHAAAVNPNNRFVASSNDGEMRWSWVRGKDGRMTIVLFRGSYDKHLIVHDRHPEERSFDNMGVVRRLRI